MGKLFEFPYGINTSFVSNLQYSRRKATFKCLSLHSQSEFNDWYICHMITALMFHTVI